MNKKLVISIDLGGTNLKIALLGPGYKFKDSAVLSTKRFTSKDNLIAAITDSIKRILENNNLKNKDILGIGLGVPGPVNERSGVAHFFPNIPGFREVNLKKILEKKIGLPFFLDNDAKLMSLAEYKLGNARKFKNALSLTLGTGVGAGIILDGDLYRGQDNAAGEIGHLPINEFGPRCNCGGVGCLEAYIGRNKILKEAKKAFRRDVSLEELSILAKKGNRRALDIWKRVGKRLGLALSGVINLLNLDAVIIGGGISNAGSVLIDQVKETIEKRAMSVQAKRVKILRAKFGDQAGLIGAAILVNSKLKTIYLLFIISSLTICHLSYAEEIKPQPIIVNGDTVEYSTDNKEVTATGNVEVIYKGAKLSCQKLVVNTETKVGEATGGARLDDEKGVIEGDKLTYNFEDKSGTIVNARFRSSPYFGKADTVNKVNDAEFIAYKGFASTCSYDHPHYRIGSKKINFFPNDKIQSESNAFYIGDTPTLYLSRFNHSLHDKLQHVPISPGHRKDWGYYLLSEWRTNLTENVNSRIYLDWREKLGLGEGFGINYGKQIFGKGDFKFYYTKEKPVNLPKEAPQEFQRYFMRWRHKWDIDNRTNLIAEFYKIGDEKRKTFDPNAQFLKDYFYREYEKDVQPLSYALFHHSFSRSTVDVLFQKRTNHWFDQLDKLPELKYSLPSLRVGSTPIYFENGSSLASYNQKAITSDLTVSRLDTSNKFSLPAKVSFIYFTPFVGSRQTVYDKGANDASMPVRTIFFSGADMSTKFYRVFNVKSNFLGMDVNNLRHVITPTVGYLYNHTPTIPALNLKQIDTVDALAVSNSAALGLSNKLQTKRLGKSVDLVDLLVTSSYLIKPKTGIKRGSNLSDILFDLKLLPYSWLRMESTATYQRSGSREDSNYDQFSDINYDIGFTFAPERSVGFGQRYQKGFGNELTASFTWRLNPKWKFYAYERYNLNPYLDANGQEINRMMLEQQYTISRDLHCWTVDLSFNSRKNQGSTLYLVFKLKAFPEVEFGFDQSYTPAKSGSQTNP